MSNPLHQRATVYSKDRAPLLRLLETIARQVAYRVYSAFKRYSRDFIRSMARIAWSARLAVAAP